MEKHLKMCMPFKPYGSLLTFMHIGVLFLFAVLPLFLGCSSKEPTEDLSLIKARLERVEKRLAQLEGTEQKITLLVSRFNKLELSIAIAKLEGSVDSKVKARTIQKKPISPSKKGYHVVREGDVLSRIAERYGISMKELCLLNQITPKTVIRPGQKLLIAPSSQR
ncbi:LysM peptidoglycan-binding domain-containing protein [Thermodesulfobacteriota bacterium]